MSQVEDELRTLAPQSYNTTEIHSQVEQYPDTNGKKGDEQFLLDKAQKSYRVTNWRWVLLVLACLLQFGNYFCFDYPSYLQNQLQADLKIDDIEYNLLYSVYSFPNIVLPLFGGIFIDILGIRKGIFLFSLILIAGQAVCMLGGINNSYGTMIAGRVIFGLGGENLTVTQSAIVANWFQGKEMGFAMGANITFGRLGSVAASYILVPLYNVENELFLPLLVGVFLCVFSWICGFATNYIDLKADKQEGKTGPQKLDEGEHIKFSDIKELRFDFWMINASCVFNYICLFPFLGNFQKQLTSRFGIDDDDAGKIQSIPYFMSSGITPIVGFIADRYGNRPLLIFFSSVCLLAAHSFLFFVPDCPDGDCSWTILLIPMILLGIFYSIYSAVLWPCVPLVCKDNIVGTAFGIVNAIQNGGLAVGPLIVGAIINGTSEDKGGYYYTGIFFMSLSALCILLSLVIWVNDLKNGRVLSKTYGQGKSLKRSARHSMLR